MTFSESLNFGKTGESQIARFLINRGNSVLPVYEKQIGEYKGPVLVMPGGTKVAPDMIVFRKASAVFIEAKHKSAFTWHRLTQRWVTGIDLHHYFDYLDITEQLAIPLWLLFLHGAGTAKATPPGMVSPTGLFGQDIRILRLNENHRHMNHGNYGMVYWAHSILRLIAPINEIPVAR